MSKQKLSAAKAEKSLTTIRVPKSVMDKAVVQYIKNHSEVCTQQNVTIAALKYYAEHSGGKDGKPRT